MTVDQEIAHLEAVVKAIMAQADLITLPQYRQLRRIRHTLADFLVNQMKLEEERQIKSPA